MITIRECARAQGFPDYYEFLSVNTSPSQITQDVSVCEVCVTYWALIPVILQKYRQIGNAVPVHLALALGKALGETMISHWSDEGPDTRSEHSDEYNVCDNNEREASEEL